MTAPATIEADEARRQEALVDAMQQAMHAEEIAGQPTVAPERVLLLAILLVAFAVFIARDDDGTAGTWSFVALAAVAGAVVLALRWSSQRRSARTGIRNDAYRLPRNGRTPFLSGLPIAFLIPAMIIVGGGRWWVMLLVALLLFPIKYREQRQWREAFGRPPVPVSAKGSTMPSEALADEAVLRVVAALSLVDGATREVLTHVTGLTPEALEAAYGRGVDEVRFLTERERRDADPLLAITAAGLDALRRHLRRLDQIAAGVPDER